MDHGEVPSKDEEQLGQGPEAGEGLTPWGSWWGGLAAVQTSVGTQWWIQSEKPELNLKG